MADGQSGRAGSGAGIEEDSRQPSWVQFLQPGQNGIQPIPTRQMTAAWLLAPGYWVLSRWLGNYKMNFVLSRPRGEWNWKCHQHGWNAGKVEMETYQQTTSKGYFAAALGLGLGVELFLFGNGHGHFWDLNLYIFEIITWLLLARKSFGLLLGVRCANKINFKEKETLLMIYSPWHTLINCFNSIIYMLTLKRTRCPLTGPFFRPFLHCWSEFMFLFGAGLTHWKSTRTQRKEDRSVTFNAFAALLGWN